MYAYVSSTYIHSCVVMRSLHLYAQFLADFELENLLLWTDIISYFSKYTFVKIHTEQENQVHDLGSLLLNASELYHSINQMIVWDRGGREAPEVKYKCRWFVFFWRKKKMWFLRLHSVRKLKINPLDFLQCSPGSSHISHLRRRMLHLHCWHLLVLHLLHWLHSLVHKVSGHGSVALWQGCPRGWPRWILHILCTF